MPGPKLPDKWEEDTRFDGPEYWGMDARWKSLFPKDGARAGYASSSGSSSDMSNSSAESDVDDADRNLDKVAKIGSENTVYICRDDSSDGEDEDRSGGLACGRENQNRGKNLRTRLTGRRDARTTSQRAPGEDEDHESRTGSSNRRIESSTRNMGTNKKGKGRGERGRATARVWRHGIKTTEPASSSRASQAWEHGSTTYLYSSEEEEEFDDAKANIVGRAQSPSTITPLRRRHRNDGADSVSMGIGSSSSSGGGGGGPGGKVGKGRSEEERTSKRRIRGKGHERGGAASPVDCGSSSDSCRAEEEGEEEIESSCSEAHAYGGGLSDTDCTYDTSSGVEGCRPGRNASDNCHGGDHGKSRTSERRLSSLIDFRARHSSPAGGGGLMEKRVTQRGISLVRETGRAGRQQTQSKNSSPKSSSREKTDSPGTTSAMASSRGEHARGESGKRLAQPAGGKKARKSIPAKGDENGWISKGAGGGGGGGAGVRPAARNPVSSFKGSQSSIRRNNDRNLKQSKLNFSHVTDD